MGHRVLKNPSARNTIQEQNVLSSFSLLQIPCSSVVSSRKVDVGSPYGAPAARTGRPLTFASNEHITPVSICATLTRSCLHSIKLLQVQNRLDCGWTSLCEPERQITLSTSLKTRSETSVAPGDLHLSLSATLLFACRGVSTASSAIVWYTNVCILQHSFGQQSRRDTLSYPTEQVQSW